MNKMRDDQEFNIHFVNLVKNERCLYDKTLPEYRIKEEHDKIWRKIASEVNESDSHCRERWRNLRACLTRHIKQQNSQNGHHKPYYLADHMNFLIPFTKNRTKNETLYELSTDEQSIAEGAATGSYIDGGSNDDKNEEYEEEYDEHKLITYNTIPVEIETTNNVAQNDTIVNQTSTKIIAAQPSSTPLLPSKRTHTQTSLILIEDSNNIHDTTVESINKRIKLHQQQQQHHNTPQQHHQQQHQQQQHQTQSIQFQPTNSQQFQDMIAHIHQLQTSAAATVAATTTPSSTSSASTVLPPSSPSLNNSPENHQTTTTTYTSIIDPKDNDDADFNFFKSLMPDIRVMSPSQKRYFKIGIFELINKIFQSK